MRTKLIALLAGIALVATGTALSATAPSDGDKRASPGPRVVKNVERLRPSEARAAGANTAGRRPLRRRFKYFTASEPTIVPADGTSPLTVLVCPRRDRAVAGFYDTDRLIAADVFNTNGARRWRFGFLDLAGSEGQVIEGIVCAR